MFYDTMRICRQNCNKSKPRPSFRSVIVVHNPNPIPVHEVGMGTLLSVRFPYNDSNQLAVLLGAFPLLLPVPVPQSRQTVHLAVLELE